MRTAALAGAVTLWLCPALAGAGTVSPTFVFDSLNTTTAQQTAMYRADLTGLGLTEIAALTVTDSGSGVGGSSGIYSGFDLDAIFLDVDGSLATTADRIFATSYAFMAGTTRAGLYAPPSPSGGPTNGSSSGTAIDESFATLDSVDAIWFGTGSLTLGDGGWLRAIFDPKIVVGSSLFLFVGEVSGDPGETVTGLIEVADTVPSVPLPGSAALLLGALGVLGLRRRRG